MKKKIGTTIGIFLLLFSGAWMLDQTEETPLGSTENIVNVENTPGLMNVTNDSQIERMNREPFVKFQPREYIRIEQR
ncbi:hypothetical protein JMM81_16500 [Bacillus sp. V3B]|uniref:hypothetical protein n=1 Tax=Bacillus sp. V3B TaxID=2804915 RepID=UPI002109A233|nr:hypothetical protein [Bacillus sp. V3B]MCQ6276515.1 hypothetical protein [Bacillus sp. V3B]